MRHAWNNEDVLTRDSRGLREELQNLRVDVDGQLLLVDKPLVARLHDCLGPVGEWLPDKRVCQVDQPLTRQLAELILLGQVVVDLSLIHI